MPEINGVEMDEFMHRSVSIDRTDINREFAEQPANYAYWAEMYAQAYREFLEAKYALEVTEARISMLKREELQAGKDAGRVIAPRGITEHMVQSAVLEDPEYAAARLDAISTEAEKVRLSGILSAIGSKKDMLVSLGANMRAEMNADPTIRDWNRESDGRDER